MKKNIYVVMSEWVDVHESTDVEPIKAFTEKEKAEKYMRKKERKMRKEWIEDSDPAVLLYSDEELRREMLKTGYWHYFITQVELKFTD